MSTPAFPALDAVPIALLPVRLQTRYTPDGAVLRIRVIPDDMHPGTHEPELTPAEVEAVKAFQAAGTATRRESWERLVDRFGATRAPYLARVVDPKSAKTRAGAWTRAPRTEALPDRWWALGYKRDAAGQRHRVLSPVDTPTAVGNPIPATLNVGPNPSLKPGDPAVDDAIRWMVDFDRAVLDGMALRVALPAKARGRLELLVVVGVRSEGGALTAAKSAERIEALLTAHRYTRGLGFVPQGTPTNNTRARPAGYRPGAADYDIELGDPLFKAGDDSNGAHASAALGVAPTVLDHTEHAGGDGDARMARRLMNEALWPATWGYYLDQLMTPNREAAAPDETAAPDPVALARDHFAARVRAGGTLPVLRVGNQPYGLVAAISLARWAADPRDERQLDWLVRLVRDLSVVWEDSLARVPRLDGTSGTAAEDAHRDLMTVLGLQPAPLDHRFRHVLGRDYLDAMWRFKREPGDSTWVGLNDTWWRSQAAEADAALARVGHPDWTGRAARAVAAPEFLTFPGPRVQRGANSESAPATPKYLAWLAGAGYRQLRDETPPELRAPPGSWPLLCLLVRHALLLEYDAAAGEILGIPREQRREAELVDVDPAPTTEDPAAPLANVWDRLAAALPGDNGRTVGAYLDDRTDTTHGPRVRLDELRNAIDDLAGRPSALLDRVLAETLDLASHRIDAWAASVAETRLAAIRTQHPRATWIGGFGWVENLEPREDQPATAGYVHAPSLEHATTAALLASGQLSQRETGDGQLSHHETGDAEPFAVDLSSRRVRLALDIADGVRQGQPLGALLGYRFERALHDAHGDAYTLAFRSFARPPTAPSGGQAPGGATESVAPVNVVDGLRLQRAWAAAGRRPEVFGSDGWPAVPAADRDKVKGALAVLDEAVDALGDALLAESVHDTARGNPARAGATLDAMATGATPPPELDVARTPRSGTAITQRVAVVLPAAPAVPKGWPKADPGQVRAAADRRLNAWAARLLPDPKRVAVRGEFRDPGSNEVQTADVLLRELAPPLSPLDVVWAAAPSGDGPSELEERFRHHLLEHPPSGADPASVLTLRTARGDGFAPDVSLDEAAEVARAARDLMAGGRWLNGDALSLPEVPVASKPDPKELELRTGDAQNRLSKAAAGLASATTDAARRAALLRAAYLGVEGAVPPPPDPAALAERVHLVSEELDRRLTAAEALGPAGSGDTRQRIGRELDRVRAILGEKFTALPLILITPDTTHPAVDPAFGTSAELLAAAPPLAATAWVQRAARVHPGAARLNDATTLAAILAGPDPGYAVGQLPAKAGDRWIGLSFAAGKMPGGRVSVVGHLPLGAPAAGQALAGILVDEWVEVIPAREETTALAFHHDAPGSAPPQAVLLAVPPSSAPWTWTLDALADTVVETLQLAKYRSVDLDALAGAGQFLPAIYLATNVRGATVATDLKQGTGRAVK